MLHPVKNAIAAMLLILSGMALAQDFDLKICVDRNGNPGPGGKPFEQYFQKFAPEPADAVISINGDKYIFKQKLNCDGIRKNHLDAINWEIEKTMRCEVYKLFQIKAAVKNNGSMTKSISDFLQTFPEGSESAATIFYLWQQTAGINFGGGYNYQEILAKMGNDGKKYAKLLEEDGSRTRYAPPPPKRLPGNDVNQSFETLIASLRNVAPSIKTSLIMAYRPEADYYAQIKIMDILEQKSPPEIVKYLLANNIIRLENFNWLALFLGMCPELPPEAIEFLKKQYVAGDPKYSQEIREKIVIASFKNPEMARWLKPYMADFVKHGKVSSKAGVAYLLITGESDPVKIIHDYVCDPTDFIYEYARATGKYNDACSLIEKIKPYQPGWEMSGMLYDKNDLSVENRLVLLKQLLGRDIINVSPKLPDGSVNPAEMKRLLLQEAKLWHPDNLPALLALTKDAQCAANAWLMIETFPVSEMPPEVAAQYFARCEQNLKSPDANVRNGAIRNLRFFNVGAQRAEAAKLLLGLLLSNDQGVATAAADSLAAMGPACMPELLEAVGGSEPYLAARSCEFIGAMGLYGQKAAPELLKQLSGGSDWILKTMIIKALALIKATDAVPEIEKYVSAKQPILASTATQALVLLKPISKEDLKYVFSFVKNYNKPAAR